MPALTNIKVSGIQFGDVVILIAEGLAAQPGHAVRLVRSKLEIFPPEYELVDTPPKGNVIQIQVPFATNAQLRAKERVPSLTVYYEKQKMAAKIKLVKGRKN